MQCGDVFVSLTSAYFLHKSPQSHYWSWLFDHTRCSLNMIFMFFIFTWLAFTAEHECKLLILCLSTASWGLFYSRVTKKSKCCLANVLRNCDLTSQLLYAMPWLMKVSVSHTTFICPCCTSTEIYAGTPISLCSTTLPRTLLFFVKVLPWFDFSKYNILHLPECYLHSLTHLPCWSRSHVIVDNLPHCLQKYLFQCHLQRALHILVQIIHIFDKQ